MCVCVLANSVRHIERELLAALIQRRIAKFEALTKSSFFFIENICQNSLLINVMGKKGFLISLPWCSKLDLDSVAIIVLDL